jgi:chromosome segregation ATPase
MADQRHRSVRRTLLVAVAGLGLVLAGCGESAEEKALNDVCDARTDIQKRVDDLQNLTLATATTDQIESDVNAIEDDVAKISDAQDDLADDRKQQVTKANATFKAELDALAEDLGSSQSLQSAAQTLRTDIANLANAYDEAFAPIDCG